MASMKATVPQYLYTERLVLELFDRNSPEHYEGYIASVNNPTAYANMGDFGLKTKADIDALLDATRLSPAYCKGMVADVDIQYNLRLGSKDGPIIGGVTLASRSASVPPDIGWCMIELYIGKGYATEGARELLRYFREDFGLQEIMSWPGSENPASCRVAEKLGFVNGGCTRVKGEEGLNAVYILPGMTFKPEGDITLSMHGDEEPKK
jgi:RimJ/RimL family protein N-acetyltransferase